MMASIVESKSGIWHVTSKGAVLSNDTDINFAIQFDEWIINELIDNNGEFKPTPAVDDSIDNIYDLSSLE